MAGLFIVLTIMDYEMLMGEVKVILSPTLNY